MASERSIGFGHGGYGRPGGGPVDPSRKVDVDGSERAFLEGARDVLSGGTTRRLLLELYLPDPDQRAVVEELAALGWRRCREHPVEEGLYNVLFER